jgi:lipopolysaccharide export system protein LptA
MKNLRFKFICQNRGNRCNRYQKLVSGFGLALLICVLALPAASLAQDESKKTAPVVEKQPAIEAKAAPVLKKTSLKKPAATVKPTPASEKAVPKKPVAKSKTSTDLSALSSDEPIHINADLAQHDRNKNLSEFVGNVKVTQGESFLKTDRLQIFHKATAEPDKEVTDAGKKDVDSEKEIVDPAEGVEKIMAIGHVYVKFDNKVAVAERAIYTTETGVLVLSGKGTKVTTGKNSIAGKKITVYRNEDRITVEGGSKNRVEAVFYSDGKGIDLKKGF